MKGSIRLYSSEEYDTEAMLDFLKKNCIDCRPGRAQEIADVVHGFGFTMGRWYHDRWDVSAYDYMYRAGNEIHLGDSRGEVTDFEDFFGTILRRSERSAEQRFLIPVRTVLSTNRSLII